MEGLLALALSLAGSANAVRAMKFRRPRDSFMAIWLLFFAQSAGSVLLAGAVLKSLSLHAVLMLSAAFFAASLLPLLRKDAERLSAKAFFKAFLRFEFLNDNKWSRAFGAVAIAEFLWCAYLACLFPPYAYDALSYHLVAPAYWIQQGQIALTPYSLWTNAYPLNAETFCAWLMLLAGSDRLVGFGQLIFACGGFFAVIGIARNFGVQEKHAMIAGCLFFLTPIVAAQSFVSYTDLTFASSFLMFYYFCQRCFERFEFRFAALAGLAGGFVIGIKSSGLAYASVVSLAVLGFWLFAFFQKRVPFGKLAALCLVFFGLEAALGCGWYLRTWTAYGNPLHPFTVSFFGKTVFQGQGTVYDLIMAANTPKSILGLPWWQQVWISWLKQKPFYSYDEGLGGFGAKWIFFELPAFIAFSVYALLKKRSAFFGFALPFVLIFLMQPSNYWTRYTIFIVAAGTVAFAFLADRIQKERTRGALLGAALIVSGLTIYIQTASLMLFGVFQTLQTAPLSERSAAMMWPQFAWVNDVPENASIASDSMNIFMYPLFGNRFTHKVSVVSSEEGEAALLDRLRESGSDYLFAQKSGGLDKIASSRPDIFSMVQDSDEWIAYLVKK